MTTATDPDVASSSTPSSEPRPDTSWPRRAWRGRADDPRWVRPALLGLLAATAVTYLWNLGASGWANSFYAAAVQAGTQSLKAWLFGSLDSGNAITVDKPPAALWVMTASARLFGFSSWSLLVPQALRRLLGAVGGRAGAGQRHRGDVHRRLVRLGCRRHAGAVPGGRRQR
jgi:hypothetical protein